MHWLCIVIILSVFQDSGASIGDKILIGDRDSGNSSRNVNFNKKSKSLARLLNKIESKYFEKCRVAVIYDSNYVQNHPVDFKLYFGKTLLPRTQEFADLSTKKLPRPRPSDKCTNYIIFLQDIFALRYAMAPDIGSKIVIVSAESSWIIKSFLKSHVSRLYKNLLVITNSIDRRHLDASYLLYTHKLYADGSGASHPLFLASWVNDSLSVEDINLFPEKLNNGFMGHRLLVSTIENPPFTIKRPLIDSGESDWDGIEIRLLKLSASYLNFTIEFTEPGLANTSPNLNSIKNDVLIGRTSAAAGGIYQTDELVRSFDTVQPFAEDCAAFISLASTALPKYRAVLGPFQLSVWLLLCTVYFVLIIPLTFNSNCTILSLLKNPSKLNTMFWFVFSTYTNSFIIKSPLLKSGIAKNTISLLMEFYWVFTIIVTACYTGSIVAFITLPVYPSAIETAEELLSYRYRIGTLDHNGWEQWFNENTTDDEFLKKLFRKMEYVPSVLHGVQNASQAYFWPYAFLASKTTLDYIIQTNFAPIWTTKRSLMHISKECFVRYNVVQIFPIKSLYTEYMNKFVNRASECGLIGKLIIDIEWVYQRIATTMNKQITKRMSSKIQVEDRTLTVEDTQGMFLILGAGFLLALLALTLESLTHCIKNMNRIDENMNESVRLTTPANQINPRITCQHPAVGITRRSFTRSI